MSTRNKHASTRTTKPETTEGSSRSADGPGFSTRRGGRSAPRDVAGRASEPHVPAAVGVAQDILGADFTNVEIHPRSSRPAAMDAVALADGNEIHFSPGAYQPGTRAGRQILGHELAHVVQQRQGRTRGHQRHVDGEALVTHSGLEAEADGWGERLARASTTAPRASASPTSLGRPESGGDAVKAPCVQLLRAGLEPSNPNNYRQNIYGPVAEEAYVDLDYDEPFTARLKGDIHTRNRTHGAPNANIAFGGAGNPRPQSSDLDQSPLVPKNANPASFSPAVDHIVRREHGGSNSVNNARIESASQNSVPANNLRQGNRVSVKLYEAHNTAAGNDYDTGDTLNRADIQDITGQDIAQNTFAGKSQAITELAKV